MNCESFDARLDALLDGRCTPQQWTEAEAHVGSCARCRQLFEAMSGRGGDLDDDAHEALAAAVVAKTAGSGRACASARERLCDYVDGELATFDRDLVAGHLARCADCSALAQAVAEQAKVLHAFCDLAPRDGILPAVLAATSRKLAEPTAAEKLSSWLARAAQRPRFNLEVAYVMTVLLLVVLGNPVDAFREATVRVQPRVAAVKQAVGGPLMVMRDAGAAKLSNVERAVTPALSAATLANRAEATWQEWVATPAQRVVEQLWAWAGRLFESLRDAFSSATTEPSATRVR